MLDGRTVACAGGTFNRLHAGHRALLGAAAAVADLVRIGVTSDAFVKRARGPRARVVRPYAQRAADVRALLERIAPGRCEVVALEDGLAPVERPEFDAIVVSPDTEKVAVTINELRASRGYAALKIVVVPMVVAEDGKPISSTRIVAGEIDAEGHRVRRARRAAPQRKASGSRAAAKAAPGRLRARRGSRKAAPRPRAAKPRR